MRRDAESLSSGSLSGIPFYIHHEILIRKVDMLTHMPTSYLPLTPQQLEIKNGGFSLAEGAVAMTTYQE